MEKVTGSTKNAEQEETILAFKTMKDVAKAFECGMENRLPCFVIFDPRQPQFYVEKKPLEDRNTDIFRQVGYIMVQIQSVDYDIREFAKEFKERHYYLSESELFYRNIHSIYHGIRVEEFKAAAYADNAEESINWEEIDRLQKNGCIDAKTLFRNFDRIKKGALPEGNIAKLFEKSVKLYPCQSDMCFPEISDYLTSSSKDYLRIANCFNTGSGSINVPRIKASLVTICLGKVVEDELNLGIFNLFRGVFSIQLPKYFDIYQNNKNNISIKFLYTEEGKEYKPIKKRNPSRDTLIAICLTIGTTVEEVQYLLKYAGQAPLYVRRKRDVIIWFGFMKHMTLDDVDEKLKQRNLKPIMKPAAV